MRSKMKNKSLCILTAAAALCLGGAVAGMGVNAATVHADGEDISYYAFIDVGANEDAKTIDAALGLTEKNATAETAGTITVGGTLFESYAEGAEYSFALEAGTYQVAVAIIAESGTAVSVGGTAVDLGSAEGKSVVSTTATVSGTLSVSVTGKLCAVLVAAEGSEILMSAEYTAGQVAAYGALLSDVLEKATGYYSNGEAKPVEIDYNGVSASAGSGINTIFTTVDVTGVVKGTNLTVSRYVITMPEDLVYFINCGSFSEDGYYEETSDPYYGYNQILFDYYKENNSTLLNDGTPDRKAPSTGEWGYYKNSLYTAPGDSAFPYNSLRWTGDSDAGSGTKGVTDMGYYLTGLTPGTQYRIYMGTLSHWHARTVNITFNENTIEGAGSLRINASKGYTAYEGVSPDSSGKIDIYMEGAGTNEPCINFIAVQKMDTVISEIPSALEAGSEIGMADHAIDITGGLQEGAKLQIYDVSRPNYVLYEEKVDMSKVTEDGTYHLDWGKQFEGISQFYIVQITNGGVSNTHRITVTDIEDFEISLSPAGYTAGTVTVNVTAHANSGITAWSYQLGEYGIVNEFALDKPATMNESFTVTENGEYIVKVYSGVGAKNDKTVIVGNIDPVLPVITVTPSKAGWEKGSYNVTLAVKGTAPVAEYKLYKDGKEVASAATAPTSIKFTEEGEYIIYVKNQAGQSVVNTLCVSAKPTMTAVKSNYANRTLTYTFADTASYKVASVTAYQVTDSRVSRMTVGSGNTMDVYDAGIYVVTVTTSNGAVEMFSINVTEKALAGKVTSSGDKDDASDANSGKSKGTAALGIGIGVGIGGIVIAAAAIIVTLILTKKKS